MHVQPHYYRMWQMKPCHGLGEVARRSFRAIELLTVCLNNDNDSFDLIGCRNIGKHATETQS